MWLGVAVGSGWMAAGQMPPQLMAAVMAPAPDLHWVRSPPPGLISPPRAPDSPPPPPRPASHSAVGGIHRAPSCRPVAGSCCRIVRLHRFRSTQLSDRLSFRQANETEDKASSSCRCRLALPNELRVRLNRFQNRRQWVIRWAVSFCWCRWGQQ